MTHAALMFDNECLGQLEYEPTTMVIAMAGVVVSFLVEYVTKRILVAKLGPVAHHVTESRKIEPAKVNSEEDLESEDRQRRLQHHHAKISLIVMECGIIFHSIRQSRAFSHLPTSIKRLTGQ